MGVSSVGTVTVSRKAGGGGVFARGGGCGGGFAGEAFGRGATTVCFRPFGGAGCKGDGAGAIRGGRLSRHTATPRRIRMPGARSTTVRARFPSIVAPSPQCL